MKLYRMKHGPIVEDENRRLFLVPESWDRIFSREDLPLYLRDITTRRTALAPSPSLEPPDLLAPIESQEVWAAGVTYYRSRDARMEEAESAGGGTFYDRVYSAPRPELFFKASPHRVVGHGRKVRIRGDSRWNVPEPELTLAITPGGRIVGYTIGNDMSSRDIEGENPLYLPQAKVYDGSCALGPGILVTEADLPPETRIRLEVARRGSLLFEGTTVLSAMKRQPAELVEYLFRDQSFPAGCFLLTGTGIVPPSTFTLEAGDEIRIEIDGVGLLVNSVS
ncbi:MAG TPA: fumarylacetoacetate hydrolase family protein [Planctomycetota bacterium]|nr:fumarylacetoacetate hydrolase family protein [Planctomycetota bacterium]